MPNTANGEFEHAKKANPSWKSLWARTDPRADEGKLFTTRGLPQEGIVFVCQEHGVQPFGALIHPLRSELQTIQEAGIHLGCGCTFSVHQDGSVRKP